MGFWTSTSLLMVTPMETARDSSVSRGEAIRPLGSNGATQGSLLVFTIQLLSLSLFIYQIVELLSYGLCLNGSIKRAYQHGSLPRKDWPKGKWTS